MAEPSIGDVRQNDRCHDLRDHEPGNRLVDAVVRADREPGHPETHRRREQPCTDVIPLAEDESRARNALRALEKRQRGRDEERGLEAVRVEDRVRDRRERDEHEPCEQPAAGLDQERLPEQPAKPPPRLGRRVVEAVLHERLFRRQVQEALEEAGRDEDDGEETEFLRLQLTGHEQRSEEAERDGEIDPGRRRRVSETNRAERAKEAFERRGRQTAASIVAARGRPNALA